MFIAPLVIHALVRPFDNSPKGLNVLCMHVTVHVLPNTVVRPFVAVVVLPDALVPQVLVGIDD